MLQLSAAVWWPVDRRVGAWCVFSDSQCLCLDGCCLRCAVPNRICLCRALYWGWRRLFQRNIQPIDCGLREARDRDLITSKASEQAGLTVSWSAF